MARRRLGVDVRQAKATKQFVQRLAVALISGVILYVVVRLQDVASNGADVREVLFAMGVGRVAATLEPSQAVTIVTTALVYCGAAAIASVGIQSIFRDERVEPTAVYIADRISISALFAAALAVAVSLGHGFNDARDLPTSHKYITATLAGLAVYVAAAIDRPIMLRELEHTRLILKIKLRRLVALVGVWRESRQMHGHAARRPSLFAWWPWVAGGSIAVLPILVLAVWRGEWSTGAVVGILVFWLSLCFLSAGMDLAMASMSVAHLLEERFNAAMLWLLLTALLAMVVALSYISISVAPRMAVLAAALLLALAGPVSFRFFRRGRHRFALTEPAAAQALRAIGVLERSLSGVESDIRRLKASAAVTGDVKSLPPDVGKTPSDPSAPSSVKEWRLVIQRKRRPSSRR